MDQATSMHQTVLRDIGQCREVSGLDRGQRLFARRYREETPQSRPVPAYLATDIFGHPLRKNAFAAGVSAIRGRGIIQPIESVRVLTGQ